MPRLVSPFENIATSNAQPKREAASVQVYHDGSWSTPRRCAGVFAIECVIKDLRSNKTSVTILEYQSSLVGSSLLPHPGAEDKPCNSLSKYTLLFVPRMLMGESSAHNNLDPIKMIQVHVYD